jgi:hypothetical protein
MHDNRRYVKSGNVIPLSSAEGERAAPRRGLRCIDLTNLECVNAYVIYLEVHPGWVGA